MKKNLNCGVCGELKYDTGKKLVCRSCRNKRAKEWQINNRQRVNEKNRRWKKNNLDKVLLDNRFRKVKSIYGLDKNQYLAFLDEHNHCCAICGEKEKIRLKGTIWNLSIDHCHKTGKIRGLLCAQCNVGLAKFRENTKYFQNAIEYLKKQNE